MKKFRWKPAVCILAAGILAGCTQTADLQASRASPSGGDGTPTSLAQFTDIPIPDGASMNLERSLIFGSDDGWIGRLVFTTSLGVQEAFAFYGREMPGFGWQEITRVRAEVSIMSYTRGARAATIQIGRPTLGGAEVILTVSPAARQMGGAQGGGAPVGTPLP